MKQKSTVQSHNFNIYFSDSLKKQLENIGESLQRSTSQITSMAISRLMNETKQVPSLEEEKADQIGTGSCIRMPDSILERAKRYVKETEWTVSRICCFAVKKYLKDFEKLAEIQRKMGFI